MQIPDETTSHRRAAHGGPFSIANLPPGTLDFSSNVSPLGPPPSVRDSLKGDPEEIAAYPDPDSLALRKSLARYTGLPEPQIAVGNGATELIYDICRAFIAKGTDVLIQAPTFGEYEAAARLSGGKVHFFESMSLGVDPEGFIDSVPNGGTVFVCNPNNPTGDLIPAGEVERIVKSAERRSSLVVIDECFIEMVSGDPESAAALIKDRGNLFVLRSLTKSFGLAGIRLGYVLGPENLIGLLRKIQVPWNVSRVAQQAGEAALSDAAHVKRAVRMIEAERAFLYEAISEIEGFEPLDSTANFILVKTRSVPSAIQRRLLREGILVRDCSSFRGLAGNYIRIAIRTRKENNLLIEAMTKT